MSRTPNPNEFLVFPIVDLDLMVFYRGSDISRPLYVPYSKFIAFITANITPASALLLQTNGTDNGSQTLLNLIEGSGITITDNGSGGITISASGGGSITADNGLTLTGSNVQLGSPTAGGAPLLHDTYIDTLVDKTLFLEGQKTNQLEYILEVNNTANDGAALKASSLGLGVAITATSISASALAANSTTAPAIAATTGGVNEAGLFTNSDSGTNNIVQGIKLRHSSSGVPASGFGIAADFTGKTTLNSDLRLGRLIFQWTNAVTSSRTSKFQVETVNSGSASVKAEILGNGQAILNNYGSGTFTGTAAYNLAVDASGNVIEVTPGGGSSVAWGAITGTLSDQTDLQSALDLKANLSGATFTGLLEADAGYDFNATGTQPSEITHSGSGDLNIAHSGSGDIVISKSGSGTILQDGTDFQEDITVPDEAYGVAWNGSLEVPTKNALYDKIETLTPVPDIAIYPYAVATYLGDINPLDIHVSATEDRLYLPANSSGTIKFYEASTNVLLGSVALSNVGSCFYIESTGELWATNLSNGTINRYDAATPGASLGTITGSGTRGIDHIEYSATKVFISNFASNSVTVVNPLTNTVDATISSASLGGTGVAGMVYVDNPLSDHDGLIAVILRSTNEVALIDPATNTVVAAGVNPSSKLNSPVYIAYDIATDQYFITNANGKNISVLTPASATTFTHVKNIDGIVNPFGIVSDETTGLVYVCFGSNNTSTSNGIVSVSVIDPSTNSIVKTIMTLGYNSSTVTVYNIDIDSTNGYIYVNGFSGSIGGNIVNKLKIR
jgi:hypothetical protein